MFKVHQSVRWLLFACSFLSLQSKLYAQTNESNLVQSMDSLFSFIKPKQPGYIVGIIRDGIFIYKKGFGLANLNYNSPMSDSSAFYMGSTSKQFTAACLLLLADQGKININDNIRKYLPEMPEYRQPVTLANLLHHTSGIREYTSLMLFSGHDISFEGLYNNDDVFNMLRRQQALNFQPGEKYTYSSGGYILLAKVIEKVAGMTLRKFADSVLFKPLGMNHTFFDDNRDEIIPNRVESYYPYQNSYRQYIKAFDMVGDGGLFTTLNDLAKWDAAFYNDRLGIINFAEKLGERYTLKNGRTIPYAWGINNDTHKGLRILEHGGFMLGYDSEILRFPDQHFTVIVLNNARGRIWTTSLANKVADLYLAAYEQNNAPIVAIPTPKIRISSARALEIAGNYWNVNYNYYNQIVLSKDTLYFDNTDGWRSALIPLSRDTFQIKGTAIKLYCSGENMQFHNPDDPNPDDQFVKYDPAPPQNARELGGYCGTYYSDELKTRYHIQQTGNRVTLTINQNPPIQIFPVKGNFTWNSKIKLWIGIGEITFLTGVQNRVRGLEIGDQRVKGVYFKKVD